jgi:hypothetical protein
MQTAVLPVGKNRQGTQSKHVDQEIPKTGAPQRPEEARSMAYSLNFQAHQSFARGLFNEPNQDCVIGNKKCQRKDGGNRLGQEGDNQNDDKEIDEPCSYAQPVRSRTIAYRWRRFYLYL